MNDTITNSPESDAKSADQAHPVEHQPSVSDEQRPPLTIYFDGECPVCSREIAAYRKLRGAEEFAWVNAAQASQGHDESVLGEGLSREAALARMHVRDANGQLIGGAAAFAAIWSALPQFRWLGRIASTRPALWILEPGYKLFLKVRPLWQPAKPAPGALPKWLAADLRTDHAGETGAVQIYRGAMAVSRDPALRAFAERHLATEQEHLQKIEQWLPPADRSWLLPIWRVSGWLTGALPALFGRRVFFQTVAAVETFVDTHYEEQIVRLSGHPEFADLRSLMITCQADEVAHRDEARDLSDGEMNGLMRAWSWLVGTGSSMAVRICRHI